MKSPKHERECSRRSFLRGAGFFGVGSAVAALTGRKARAAQAQPVPSQAPPPAYDVERFKKVDPSLLHYEQSAAIPAPHDDPRRLALAPDGLLLVTAGRQVTALDRQYAVALEFSAGQDVRSVAVAPDGLIYLGLLDHVEVFDRQGKRQAAWAPPASQAWLTGLSAGEKDVFAADARNRIVYRYDRSGQLLGRIGEKDKARGIPGFVVPSPYFDLKIGPGNLLWVANPGRSQMEAYTFDGRLERTWGEGSFSIAGFCGCCNPSHFALLPDGRFVTSEKGLPRIKVYSIQGRFESVVAGPDSFPKYFENLNAPALPMDVAVDAGGRIYVADTLGRQIRVYRRKLQG